MKKTTGLKTLILILTIIIILLTAYIIYNKQNETTNDKQKQEENNQLQENNIKPIDDDFYTNLLGTWSNCHENELGNNICSVLIVEKDGEAYTYKQGIYQTDASIYGYITNVENIDNSNYQLKILSIGCKEETCMDITETKILTRIINIENIKNQKIDITQDNTTNTYEFITSGNFNTNSSEIEDYFEKQTS